MMFEMWLTPVFMAFESTPLGPNTMAATVAKTATTTIHSTISAPRSSRTAFTILVIRQGIVLSPSFFVDRAAESAVFL